MVFTVEPGIYIPAEGFGIRLEDDLVIQESGEPFNLMRNIPIEVDEIESLMNLKSYFNILKNSSLEQSRLFGAEISLSTSPPAVRYISCFVITPQEDATATGLAITSIF
jgi:hypothetical protein